MVIRPVNAIFFILLIVSSIHKKMHTKTFRSLYLYTSLSMSKIMIVNDDHAVTQADIAKDVLEYEINK
ncbi:hypothetical protein PT110_09545 [Erysipelothrix rhusiopathiae]|nr:hypothetical protein [Erysipelothrix rhusiopathiae]